MLGTIGKSTILSVSLLLALVGAGGALGQTTYYVSPSGSDAALGTSGDPLATILEGIGRSSSDGEIILFDGTYSGAGNRDIYLPEFPLTIRSHSDNAWECVINCGGSLEANHRAFIVDAGQDTTTVLRGITIRDGYMSSPGGALYVGENSNIKVEHCIFDNNYAYPKGGAVMKEANPSDRYARKPVFRRCMFTDNHAIEGGGIYVWMYGGMWIDGCDFDGNTGTRGAALLTYFETDVLIDRTWFRNNTAIEAGGAIDMSMEQSPEVNSCWFSNNEAAKGGAIANRLGLSKKGAGEKSYGDFFDCTFEDNTAEEGGVYYSWSASAYNFTRCVFRNNFASTNGGAVKELYNGVSGFHECLFVGNTAGAGGAFFRDDLGDEWVHWSTTIDRCTFVGNGAITGGAIAQTGVTTNPQMGVPHGYVVTNSIIAFGTAGGAIAVENGGPPLLECVDIYGNSGGDWTGAITSQYWIDGNFDGDPCFCDADDGNYELCAASPCLPGASPAGWCLGLIGAYDQGCSTPSGVDMSETVPAAYRLVGAYPNPFNPVTAVVYELAGPATVTLRVYDLAGRLVQVLEERTPRGPGRHEAEWRGRNLQGHDAAAGVYLVRMEAGDFSSTGRLTLIR
ncbi:MAG: T9SS type A sorting domain-containing protein [bacterium]|nr:T9SS type A sorting domain-containing protein [bacterium]